MIKLVLPLSLILLIIIASLFFIPALPALCGEPSNKPMLRLEMGMHTGYVKTISIDRDNRFLVTGSDDKTVRVWEMPDLRLVRTLRPPIGDGMEGQIYAVAISPDGQTIAAAGWTGYEWNKRNAIYLFDRESEKMTRPKDLQGLPGVIFHLAYSKDGRFLVATLQFPYGIRVYQTSDYTLFREDLDYEGDTFGADFDLSGRLVTASEDGLIRLYDKGFTLPPKKSSRFQGRPHSVSFSPDNMKIAVGLRGKPWVDVLSSKNLSHLYSPSIPNLTTVFYEYRDESLSHVGWSSDGLYAGGMYHNILRWTDPAKGSYQNLPASRDSILEISPLKNGGIALGASDGFGIFDQNANLTKYKNKEIADFRNGEKGFLVSYDGSTIQFGFQVFGKFPVRFSISNRVLNFEPLDSSALSKPITEAERLEIIYNETYKPTLNGQPLKIEQDERSRSLAICPDTHCFLLGTSWNLRLFNQWGAEKWHKAIPATCWSVNIAGNGKVAVAAFGDGTIHWYRMKDGEELLALFPHKDRKRWALWTPSGYYDASPGGEDLIGWHLNRGPDQAADFFPVSRFRSSYYRPDVIEEVLKTLDLDEAVKLANLKAGIKERARAVQEILPPVVEIISPADNSQVETKTVTFRYRVRSPTGDPVTGIRVFIDGGLSKEERELNLAGAEIAREIQVGLPERDCEIGIVAQNRHGWGATAKRQIMWIGPKDEKKGVLYVVAVGVSNYQDEALKKGVERAAKDAMDFAEYMKEKKRGSLYRDVRVTVLPNNQATRDRIIKVLRDISIYQATVNDLIMLFLSGHGEKDESRKYRYLLADADKERSPSRCLSHSDIRDPLVAFPGRRVIFIDTCRSGFAIDINGFANGLASSENGRVVVFTSATGNQSSEELPGENNGAFTKVLLEGLRGKAANEQQIITVSRLRVVLDEGVPKLTNGRQTPDFIDLGGGPLELAEVIN